MKFRNGCGAEKLGEIVSSTIEKEAKQAAQKAKEGAQKAREALEAEVADKAKQELEAAVVLAVEKAKQQAKQELKAVVAAAKQQAKQELDAAVARGDYKMRLQSFVISSEYSRDRSRRVQWSKKLDGVGPVDNRPSTD